ncbi:MAG TPA: histidine kinase [Thermoanaerobaculia bacterium]|nr:histidine kinase [Thermoanaerobaculia bacterium]
MDARYLRLVGVLTWLLVGVPGVLASSPHHVIWIICYAAFLPLFLLGSQDECAESRRIIYAAAQSIAALVCVALQPADLTSVLLVIVAAEVGSLPLRVALPWIAAQTILLGLALGKSSWIFATLAYYAFQLFAAFSLRIAHQESEARRALAAANAELQVATGLLDIGSRTEERLRIARDLHDVLGHHLTALTLNLEVATHLTDGPAREQIEKSKSIAKTLLGDVRGVVSRLRNNEPVDVAAAIYKLRDIIEKPAVHVRIDGNVSLTDPAVAQVALRAVQEIVTNAVRHSGGRNLSLALAAADHTLTIDARDDGSGTDHVSFGNGLRGMRERVEQLHGTMRIESVRGKGFEVHVELPLQETST